MSPFSRPTFNIATYLLAFAVSSLGTTCPSRLTSPSFCLVALNSHIIYSVLVLLSLKPFDSKVFPHSSNFLLTLVLLSSTSTTSSAKSMHQGISSYISLVTSSITKATLDHYFLLSYEGNLIRC